MANVNHWLSFSIGALLGVMLGTLITGIVFIVIAMRSKDETRERWMDVIDQMRMVIDFQTDRIADLRRYINKLHEECEECQEEGDDECPIQ